MVDLVADWLMIWSEFIWTIFSNEKWTNEFAQMNSDQIINQSATRSTMVQVLIDQNYNFMKTHLK